MELEASLGYTARVCHNFKKKQKELAVQWFPGTPWAKAAEETYSASTQLIASCTPRTRQPSEENITSLLFAPFARSRSPSRCEDMLLFARRRSPLGASAACTTPPCLNLGSISLLSHEEQAGQRNRVKLTGNKLNQSRAVTKGTRNVSTVLHPTGWPWAQIFHYNFQREGEKKEKNVSQKHYESPNLGRPVAQPKICERLAFQGVKTQHVEPGKPFKWWEGSLKPLLFCTKVSKLHRSLRVSEPQRKEGRVKEINQKFLWDTQMPTWNRLSARILSTLTTARTFQNKSRRGSLLL